VVQAILAYEWFVSGLDKRLDRGFSAQLSALLSESTHGNGGSLYGVIMAHLVLPNHTLFALLTPWTETSIGAIMLLGAILWMVSPHAPITDLVARAACLALLTAATLDLNYYLLGGGGCRGSIRRTRPSRALTSMSCCCQSRWRCVPPMGRRSSGVVV
jgi:hypothetical protein